MDVDAVCLLFPVFPSTICTEMLARDKSTPELWKACVKVFTNLFNSNTSYVIDSYQPLLFLKGYTEGYFP